MGGHPRFWVAFSIWCAAITLCLAVLGYQTTAAHAQAMCASYQEVQKALLEKFHEHPSGAGVTTSADHAITLFTSPNGESWTLVIVDTKGKACLVSVGKNWSDIAEAKGEPS